MLKNESFEKSAIRLAKSELGIKINPKKLIFAGVINEIHSNSIYPNINYHSVNMKQHLYFGQPKGCLICVAEQNRQMLNTFLGNEHS